MNKFSLIKGVGILAICIMTFFNTQLSGEQFSNQESLNLDRLIALPQAQAEDPASVYDGGWFCCLGWGVPCSCYQQPEQKERCSYCS